MEVKINKEIRQYTENIFFGLSLRQFIFSVLACIVAIIIYFTLRPFFNISTLSWFCMAGAFPLAGAFPFALLGFIKYNGMSAEKFVIAWVKSEILMPKRLIFKPNNYYLDLYKQSLKYKDKQKKKKIKDDKKQVKE